MLPHAHGNASEPSAADVATARELFRDGARLAQNEQWQEALDAYERSMALRPSHLTRYGIAVCQERLGRLVEAMENLRIFLGSRHDRSTIDYVPTARDLLSNVEKRVGRIKVVVPGNPRGVSVKVDDKPLPEAAIGVFRLTDPGQRKLEAHLDDYAPFFENVDLKDGESIEIVVRFSLPGTEDPQKIRQGEVHDDTNSSQASRTIGTALTIGGAGVFVTGLGLGIYGYSKAKNAENSDGSEASTARKTALVGDISMGLGLVALGVGTYFLLVKESEPPASTSKQWVISPAAIPGLGLAASRRF